MNNRAFFTSLLLCFQLSAQDFPGNTYGESKFDRGIYLRKVSDGNLLAYGYSNSFSSGGDNDFYIIKTDLKGNIIWELNYGGTKSDIGFGFEEIGNRQGYLTVGFSESYGADEDIVVSRISEDGKVVWLKNLPRHGRERGWSIRKLKDGNFMVVGQTQNRQSKVYYGMMTKIDVNGNILWQNTYGEAAYNRIYYCVENKTKDFIVVGLTRKDSISDNSGLILKINKDGGLVKSYPLNSLKNITPHGIYPLSKNEIMVMGYAQMDTAKDHRSVYIAMLDGKGNLKWEKGIFEKDKVNHSLSAVVRSNGDILMTGYSRPLNAKAWNGAIWSLKRDGTLNWKREYGGDKVDQLYTITDISKNQFAITGHTFSSGNGDADIWIMVMDDKGDVIN